MNPRYPCRDCPPGSKKEARYADENGKPRQLCAAHARKAGCWRSQSETKRLKDELRRQREEQPTPYYKGSRRTQRRNQLLEDVGGQPDGAG